MCFDDSAHQISNTQERRSSLPSLCTWTEYDRSWTSLVLPIFPTWNGKQSREITRLCLFCAFALLVFVFGRDKINWTKRARRPVKKGFLHRINPKLADETWMAPKFTSQILKKDYFMQKMQDSNIDQRCIGSYLVGVFLINQSGLSRRRQLPPTLEELRQPGHGAHHVN